MDKFDYITATIEEEKIRLEKLINYMEENNIEEDIIEYKERYNNVCKYLVQKDKYLNIKKNIDKYRCQLDELNEVKDEYEVDNILLEDTLLSKFHEDTIGKYRNLLYEDISKEDSDIKEILYLLFEKESNYNELVNKRNKLLEIIDKNKYSRTYDTLVSQNILIEKQESILDDIFVIENNIKIEEDKLSKLENSVMVIPILKILYEFWIINSYDPRKVDKSKVFTDNKTFVNIKNTVPEEFEIFEEKPIIKEDITKSIKIIPDLNLPGIDEDTFVDIDGKDYVNNDK